MRDERSRLAEVNINRLVGEAIEARNDAYVPYSGFAVGAALLTEGGEVYRGANIENAAYTPTVCAERTAFFKAVSEGKRGFSAIAVVGWHKSSDNSTETHGFAYPCGVCRQVMMEFCKPDFRIIVAESAESYRVHTLSELLPHGFGPDNL